jgi:hypothetical protein
MRSAVRARDFVGKDHSALVRTTRVHPHRRVETVVIDFTTAT